MRNRAVLLVVLAALTACRSARSPSAAPAAPVDTSSPAVDDASAAGAAPEEPARADAAPAPDTGADSGTSPASVRVTPAVAASCGPDSFLRQPHALADLDRDGALERVSVVRDGDSFVVRLHRLPDLAAAGEWRVRGDYVEVGTTRCKDRTDGDLWLHVGVAHDPRGESWTHTLYHLAGGELVAAAEDLKQSNLSIDNDGDGCVDPAVLDGEGGGRWLHDGAWERLPAGVNPMRLAGAPFGRSQQESVDLDGDGERELLVMGPDLVSVVDVPSWRTSWQVRGPSASARVTSWQGRTVVAAGYDETFQILAADAEHAALAKFDAASYAELIPELDPAGDGSVLALHEQTTQLLDARAPAQPTTLAVTLAGPLSDVALRLGPVRIDGDPAPDLLGVRMLEPGHPMLAFAGSRGTYELLLLPPPGTGEGRVIRQAEVNGALQVTPQLVDLEGDGTYEIVLEESAGFSSCDRESNGSTATLYLLDGDGTVLWTDESRTEYFGGPGPAPDLHAHARALELGDGGPFVVRVRAGNQEWYLLPAGSALPDLPVCLE
jgi:hypothetical protein